MRKVKLSLHHEFTHEELDSRRDELAQVTIRAGEKKDQAKAQAAALKEDLDILDGRRKQLSREIVARGEDRLIECLVRFNIPKPGQKQTLRLDTGEIVRESEAMTRDERQAHLFADPDVVELEKIYGGDGPPHETEEPAASVDVPPFVDGKTAAAGDDSAVSPMRSEEPTPIDSAKKSDDHDAGESAVAS